MSHEYIIAEQRGRVGIITFNRPDRLNAMIPEMGIEVREQLEAWETDYSVGAIVLTGAGRAFCSGADISNFERQLSAPNGDSSRESDLWYLTLRAMSKPTIAAINGVAVGLGITCTLLCDIRLAAPDAKLSFRFVRLGLTPELGSTHTLPRLVGLQRANEVMLTGRFFTGQEAKDMGLVLETYPKEEVSDRAVELAQSIAEAPAWQLAETKRMLRDNSIAQDFDAIDRHEAGIFMQSMGTPEHSEAIAAFREKRDPRFH